MKATFRIAGEMYEFVEVEVDLPDSIIDDLEKIAGTRDALKRVLAPRPINELPPKEWDMMLENQLQGKTNHTELIARMSPAQRKHYNDNKRAINRINSWAKKLTE